MAQHSLSKNFAYFFGKLNPSRTFEQKASAHYAAVKGLIEDRSGLASVLAPTCFLQGSYRNETATYTMNDVDIVALCELWQPGSGSGSGWSRDEIFDTVAAPLANDWWYKNEVRYDDQSMCIKLDVEPRIEILPVVYKSGNADPAVEPFRLYRPENRQWEDGYARYHRQGISYKNRESNTANNFVPAIKVLKHLRTRFGLDAVSFHIECLLFSFPDNLTSAVQPTTYRTCSNTSLRSPLRPGMGRYCGRPAKTAISSCHRNGAEKAGIRFTITAQPGTSALC